MIKLDELTGLLCFHAVRPALAVRVDVSIGIGAYGVGREIGYEALLSLVVDNDFANGSRLI